MPLHSITEKPNERCPSPVVPAYANFELAKRMHQDNLDHQPLPDCVADLAFRRAQISGGHAGLALEIDPIATGVGVKTHNAGPTHCTKMKVFRPKTGGGIVPRALGNGDAFRGVGSAPAKKMGPMDLAICWDFKPANPSDEPRLARHIDGSNDSAGPAVFTCVKTPREEQSSDLGRSAGVFTSTLGEADFFDKDILRKRTDFGGARVDREDPCACDYSPPARQRARSVSRDSSASHCRRGSGIGGPTGGVSFGNLAELPGRGMPDRLAKQYQSSPLLGDKAYQALREKYLGPDSGQDCRAMDCRPTGGPPCKRDVLLRRPARRLCHKVAPAPRCCPPSFGGHGHHHGHGHGHGHCLTSKAAFRAGVPKHNASGDFVGIEPGCGGGGGGGGRVLVVPRPRQPYAKKNYDIETLVPPFQSQAGGAGQGGYPEHWRLASVYQHAYKPIDQRRRPLLQTVYNTSRVDRLMLFRSECFFSLVSCSMVMYSVWATLERSFMVRSLVSIMETSARTGSICSSNSAAFCGLLRRLCRMLLSMLCCPCPCSSLSSDFTSDGVVCDVGCISLRMDFLIMPFIPILGLTSADLADLLDPMDCSDSLLAALEGRAAGL
uniref:EG:84H4.4 protein n=1 Tax=Drosophila melanogaster TaxID=7227 RepID=O77280_DROME|nr:EG:84H4.4 [Drosophila melanogaster]